MMHASWQLYFVPARVVEQRLGRGLIGRLNGLERKVDTIIAKLCNRGGNVNPLGSVGHADVAASPSAVAYTAVDTTDDLKGTITARGDNGSGEGKEGLQQPDRHKVAGLFAPNDAARTLTVYATFPRCAKR